MLFMQSRRIHGHLPPLPRIPRLEMPMKRNYDPPTEQEIKDSQDAKQRGETEKTPEENTNNNQSTQSVVPVAISSASVNDNNLEIRATPHNEGTGECTATISRGSKSVTSKSTALSTHLLLSVSQYL